MSSASTQGALAIIGMECRLPGADGLAEYWSLIRRGGSELGPLPPDRFDRQLYYDPRRGVVGKSYTDIGGIISSRPVDFSELPLPEELIQGQDPAHLILCEVAARAVRDGGYDPFALPERNVGVYVGHTGGSEWVSDLLYSTIVAEGAQALRDTPFFAALGADGPRIIDEVISRTRRDHGGRRPSEALDLSALAASSLISRAFGLAGPYMVVDAACASSMQAMAVGIRSLLHGRIDMALVGGASYCKSGSLILFSAAQSVSPTGSCPFGLAADGLVTAEGYVVLVLKTLERALADGDRIRAVIRGLGVSSDGKGKSLWAPREEGQKLAVMRAYGEKLDPSRLQYIEAHATSTQVGDATEMRALGSALKELLPDHNRKIPIGSAKGNVGHTLETAGMAGLVRAVLAMEHGIIPPAVGDGRLNKEINWEESPFYVPFKEEPWPAFDDGHPRRAAVNAFGIGGLNVHVVLDEFVAPSASTVGLAGAAPSSSAGTTPRRPADRDTAIAIIGRGCVLPGAQSISAFWDLLMSGRDPKRPVPQGRWDPGPFFDPNGPAMWKVSNTVGAYIDDFNYDWKRHKVPPLQITRADPLQFMLLEAADQALEDAGYGDRPFDRTRVSAVVGTVFGSDFGDQLAMGLRLPEFTKTLAEVLRQKGVPAERIEEVGEQFKGALLDRMPALLDESGSFTCSTLASRITKAFNLMGGAFAMDAGSCSGHFALMASVDMLLDGTNDMVVCAAGQRCMDAFAYEWTGAAGLLSRGMPRPAFDADADGYVLGEGCGVVVLKRLQDAQRDGDTIRGVIRGIGASRSSDPGKAIETAIRDALREARLSPEAVSAVEAYGMGLPGSDQQELAALDRVLGQVERTGPLVVGTIRSQFGETGGAAGVVALLKATEAIRSGVFPGTLGFSRPQAGLVRLADRIRVSSEAIEIPPRSGSGRGAIGITGCSDDMAFHLVVDDGTVSPTNTGGADFPPRKSESPATVQGRWRLVRFTAVDFASMRQKLSDAATDVAGTFERRGPDSFLPCDVMRMAIIADCPETLSKRLKLALAATTSDTPFQKWEEQGIVLTDRVHPRPKAVALFPGQGSQYPGMLKELADVSSGARRVLEEAHSIMTARGWEPFEHIAWDNPEGLGVDLWITQVSLLVADMMAYRAAQDLGLAPDFVGGHSYGEFPALVAAGAWSLQEAMLATRVRCDAIAASSSAPSSMLSVLASQEKVETLMAQQSGQVWVSAVNSPEQVVLGGITEAIQRFEQRCAEQNVKTRLLNVPRAFHTPLMSDTCAPLARGLAECDIQPPTTPLLSSVTAKFVCDPDDIRQGLVRQMTVPVLYEQMIRRSYDLGGRVFLEIGPSNVLTQLAQRVLAEAHDVSFACIDHRNRSDHEQIVRFQATLEVHDLTHPFKATLVSSASQTRPAVPVVAAIPATTSEAVSEQWEPASRSIGSIRFADATERRRARHRQQADKPITAAKSADMQTSPVRSGAPAHSVGHLDDTVSRSDADNDSLTTTTIRPDAAVSHEHTSTVWTETSTRLSISTTDTRALPVAATELEQFLVSFVVEQTGYPAEIVELDADLEADLGIDSIKKAQLFGELGEHFTIEPDENLTLDSFPTLGHVRDYLLTQLRIDSAGENGRADTAAAVSHGAVPEPPAMVVQSASASIEPMMVGAAATASRVESGAASKLEEFLVNFVVEQTGYPPEVIELDADLEADLGIDSIKKAQLFGELGEHFEIVPDENLTLDDFPTLGHVRDYLLAQPGVGLRANEPSEAVTQPVSAKPAAAAIPAPSLPVVADASASAPIAPSSALTAELEEFLINFVIEQTGYPAEIVELDADLEADLGIDSIKKAQMFGEIAEHYELEPDERLSLDDFPTLRHALDYIVAQQCPESAGLALLEQAACATPVASSNPVSSEVEVLAGTGSSGSAYELGFKRGRVHAASIQRLLRRHADRLQPDLIVSIGEQAMVDRCTRAEREELRGMAHGANVLEESLWAVNLGTAHTGLLPLGCHWSCRKPGEGDTNVGGLSMHVSCGVPIELESRQDGEGNGRVVACLPGVLGTLGGFNEFGLSAAVWGVDTATSIDVPWAVCLDVDRVLATCANVDDAIHFCRDRHWPSNVWLTLAGIDRPLVSVVRWTNGKVRVECHEREVALLGAPGMPVTLSCPDLHAGAVDYLRRHVSTGGELCGLERGHWLALAGGSTALAFASGDESRLTGADEPQWQAVQLAIHSPELASTTESIDQSANASDAGSCVRPVTQRYVMRLAELPEGIASQRSNLHGPVLILGHNSTTSDLKKELQSRSIPVSVMPADRDFREIVRYLESQAPRTLPRTLILTTALDEVCPNIDDYAFWQRRRQPGLFCPYQVCQAWVSKIYENQLTQDAALVGIVSLGGDLGISGEMGSPEGGAITGLLKAVKNEFQELFVRVIDIGVAADTAAGAAILEECSIRDGETEVALRNLHRLALRPAFQPCDLLPPVSPPRRGSQWVITGGARGVTAVVARELGRRFGLRLHLVGVTSVQDFDRVWLEYDQASFKAAKAEFMIAARRRGVNPMDEWKRLERSLEIERNLKRMRDDGVEATYHACDVSDLEALTQLFNRIRQRGPITGVVHGAGYEAACRFDQKKIENVSRTLGAKNDGAACLFAVTAADPLEYFIGFGSTSGRMGGVGQTDYSLANDLLAKQIDRFRRERPNVRTTVFHWYAWDEVGMAARPESRFALEAFGLTLMPLREGVNHFLAEIDAGLPEPEVLISESILCPVTVDVNERVAPMVPNGGSDNRLRFENERLAEPPIASVSVNPDQPDWASFLVNFVVEQTGYPPEIVELDADLEADFGIDSIKKAQMFGEIGEQFEIEPDENLTLDDFPTLRDVVRYLESRNGGAQVRPQLVPAIAATNSSGIAVEGQPSSAGRPRSISEPARARGPASEPSHRPATQPLIEWVECRDGAYIAHCVLDPSRDPLLLQHRMNGRPVLPAVGALELFAQMASAIEPATPVHHLLDVDIHQALRFPSEEPREIQLMAKPCPEGWSMKLVSDVRHRNGTVLDAERVHVTGRVIRDSMTLPLGIEFEPPRFPPYPMEYPDNAPMYHGPALRTLKRLLFQRDGGWAELVAPNKAELAGPRPASGWILPCAMLDGTLVASSIYSLFMCGPRIEIPSGFERLDLLRDPLDGEQCVARLMFQANDERHSWFDFVLFGADGTPILKCRGLRNVLLSSGEKT